MVKTNNWISLARENNEAGQIDYEILCIPKIDIFWLPPKRILEAIFQKARFESDVVEFDVEYAGDTIDVEYAGDIIKISAIKRSHETIDSVAMRLSKYDHFANLGSTQLKSTSKIVTVSVSCTGNRTILIEAQAKCFQTGELRGLDCVALRVRGLKEEKLEMEKKLVDEEIEHLYPRILEWIKQCPLTETVKEHNSAYKSKVSFFLPKRKKRKRNTRTFDEFIEEVGNLPEQVFFELVNDTVAPVIWNSCKRNSS